MPLLRLFLFEGSRDTGQKRHEPRGRPKIVDGIRHESGWCLLRGYDFSPNMSKLIRSPQGEHRRELVTGGWRCDRECIRGIFPALRVWISGTGQPLRENEQWVEPLQGFHLKYE